MSKRILVTGGCGFIGHHFCEHLLKNTDWTVVVLDKLTYASSGFDRLRDVQCFNNDRVLLLGANFAQPLTEGVIQEIGEVDYIVHMGAETHVDRSIENAEPFVIANVLGTHHMLEFARKQKRMEKFVMFSTDEVYGPQLVGSAREGDPYNSTNPYSATKAGAECLCVAYANTYKMPIVISNTMNVVGERQDKEKYVPKVIRKVLDGELLEVHANPELTKAGSRFYIHARNVADAVLFILNKTTETLSTKEIPRGRFNIVGEKEFDNLELAQFIAKVVGKPLNYQFVNFHEQRPGHDLRYALSGAKLKRMGWTPPKTIEESLEHTIKWTLQRPKWLGRGDA